MVSPIEVHWLVREAELMLKFRYRWSTAGLVGIMVILVGDAGRNVPISWGYCKDVKQFPLGGGLNSGAKIQTEAVQLQSLC